MEENLEGLGVGGHDDELGDTTVEGLGGLVGSLLELAVVRRLLNKIEDLLGEGGIGQGEGCDSSLAIARNCGARGGKHTFGVGGGHFCVCVVVYVFAEGFLAGARPFCF